MRKYILTFLCSCGLCCIGMWRIQNVTVTDAATQKTQHYWRIVLPNQDRYLNLEAKGRSGSWQASEYNFRGLYGLWKVDRLSGYYTRH